MSDNHANLTAAADRGVAGVFAWVQPREITESAFRALCAAGAEPAEAREGGLAVLRAEVAARSGLALLEQLLAADWAQPVRAAATRSTGWGGLTVHELDCPNQPALRSALQLIDLAVSGSPTEVRVSRTTVAGIPQELWKDLILRRSADLQRTINVAISTAAGAEYLAIHNGGVISAADPPSASIAASVLPRMEGDNTVVVVLPGTAELEKLDATIAPKPLKVSEPEWLRMYQLSRTYLMADQ
ncbi:hypothetical protein [Arthrobacter dokdonensis]|uniref:hypothetical protein n=1 Tax=Arthrobacter dokdonellae TaxID=2211210 RepID=UPI000DE5A853|nr:hypothetical protein [Arthrobacter dokdonellae]